MKRLNQNKDEELLRAQAAERKRLPKILRSETKTRTMMFRESLKIRNVDPSEMSMRIKDFEEFERKRIQQELKKRDMKHKKRMVHLKAENDAALKELELLQVRLFDLIYNFPIKQKFYFRMKSGQCC